MAWRDTLRLIRGHRRQEANHQAIARLRGRLLSQNWLAMDDPAEGCDDDCLAAWRTGGKCRHGQTAFSGGAAW